MSETINRETSWKGQRLQKIRLAKLLLESIDANPKTQVFGAIEYGQDVFFKDRSEKDPKLKFEEDKNYSNSSFTFNSHEVINTLVSLLDIWINGGYSKNIKFAFYTTADISKEATTSRITKGGITLPDKPILELFTKRDFNYPNFISASIALLKAEYEDQYAKKSIKGNLSTVNELNESQYKEFFELIDWAFNEIDEVTLKQHVISQIQASRLFNDRMKGKEEMIFATIIELIEEKQGNTDKADKFIHYSEIYLIFNEAESGIKEIKPEDPVWELWNGLTPSDTRNIKDKIQNVCNTFSNDKIEIIARKVSRSLIEREAAANNSFLSIRYRVFEECKDELVKVISSGATLTEGDIELLIDRLTKQCVERINSLSNSWSYSYKDEKVIQGIILELFDSCFLAFDKI
ncbi:MAG: hypothetical protein LCH32_00930 [Bacteroidetes bacterium]|nr:hypothetical protein [Bacteroidota bacterium]